MTAFELSYLALRPFLLPLYSQVRERLLEEVEQRDDKVEVLDVGTRKSHYTVGVPARISISDLPRECGLYTPRHFTENLRIVAETRQRRSNLCHVIFDDMTRSAWRDLSFDCVVAVELLDRVEHDAKFVEEVHRVLKPGGLFLLTTPNGDTVFGCTPEHRRRYRRDQLVKLLSRRFEEVEVEYSILDTKFRRWGLLCWSLWRPFGTARSMVGNLVSACESRQAFVSYRALGTRHLIASARKRY